MKKGFTLIEVLVVMAISAILTAVALVYNNASRNEVALTVEAAKISQFLLRAESLSIASYGSNSNPTSPVCGYGMTFDLVAQTYGIFEYHPAAAVGKSCRNVSLPVLVIDPATEMQPYTMGTWNLQITRGVKLVSGPSNDDIAVVLFFPPSPETFISLGGSNYHFLSPTQTSKAYLTTADGSDSRVISVNPAGQVSF